MSPDNEDDPDSSSEIPSFEDLVARVEGDDEEAVEPSQAAQEPAADSETAVGAEGGEETASDTAPTEPVPDLDEAEWELGGGTEEPSAAPPAEESGTGLSDSKADALLELIDGASNVLVVGPAETPVEYDLCAKLCTTEPHARRRLLVTTEQSPDERLNALRGYGAGSFDESVVVAVGDQMRSSNGDGSSTHEIHGEAVTVETINNPRDLTRLGLLINKHLAEPDEGPPAVVCFHTLSSLLQFVEVEKAFRFLHVLQGRVRTANARAHYHLDPSAHDEQVLHTLRPIFDFTVRFDANGDVAVDS